MLFELRGVPGVLGVLGSLAVACTRDFGVLAGVVGFTNCAKMLTSRSLGGVVMCSLTDSEDRVSAIVKQ